MFHSDNKLKVEWLADVPFLKNFTSEDLQSVADLGERGSFSPGEVLVDQGRFGTECFLIVTGEAVVRQSGEYVTSVGIGTMVGEMALVEHRPRNSTVVAETDMTVVSFGIGEFSELLDLIPAAKEKILKLLSERVQENQDRD